MPKIETNMRNISGFPNYSITKDGRVWSEHRQGTKGSWLHPYKDSHGYFQVSLSENNKRTNKLVHHLVLETFGPSRQEKQIARHLNGIKTDNRIGNLCWGTFSENQQDSIRLGMFPNRKGESNGRAKLTKKKVLQIRVLYCSPKYSLWDLAHRFNMSLYAIWAIVTRRTWKHI